MHLALYVIPPIFVSLCWAQTEDQAPGDEHVRCTEEHSSPPTYLDTERNLMDSYNYEQLLPGNGTGNDPIPNAVWNDFSFDDNDVTPEVTNPTYWQQRSGGLCRFRPRVCGWRRGTTIVAQNNWLFTQYINKSFNSTIYDYAVTIHVMVAFSTPNCRERNRCKPWLNIHHYMTNSVQLPSTEGNGFMNRENYVKFAAPKTSGTILTYTFILNFTLPSSSTGFYISAQDPGGCITLSRMRVYRGNCRAHQIGLVKYPSAPAPVSGSARADISCVENADVVGSSSVMCQSDGTWSSQNNPVCQCRPGYVNRLKEGSNSDRECFACPLSLYLTADNTCETCPEHTETCRGPCNICPCEAGYFRNDESNPETVQFENPRNEGPNTACTRPSSVPQNVGLTPSRNSITVRWSPPAEDGGRTDLYYELSRSDHNNTRSYNTKVYRNTNSRSYTFSGFNPFTEYCVRVTAHNGVSDQDPDGSHLRTVEECVTTSEAPPGVVTGVQGTYPYVVWNPPEQPNGFITGYRLTFTRSGTSRSITTDNDQTFYIIQSSNIPWTSGSFSVSVTARNCAGFGATPSQSFTLNFAGGVNPSPTTVTTTVTRPPSTSTRTVTSTTTTTVTSTTCPTPTITPDTVAPTPALLICDESDRTRPSDISGVVSVSCGHIEWNPATVPGCSDEGLTYRIRIYNGTTYEDTDESQKVVLSSTTNSLTFSLTQVPSTGPLRATVKARRSNGVFSRNWSSPVITYN